MSNASPPAPPTSAAIHIFRYSKIGIVLMTLILLIFASLLGLCLYLDFTMPEDPERSALMMKAIFILLALTVFAAVLLFITIKRRKAHFEVHADGLVHQRGGQRHYARFADIEDLYLFASGNTAAMGLINNLAYRTRPGQDWQHAMPGLARFDAFLDEVRQRHTQHRCEVLQERIEAGQDATFRYINNAQVLKRRVAGNFLKLDTHELALSAQGLSVAGQTWAYQDLQPVTENDWTEQISIKDNTGKTVFSCFGTGILGADAFIALFHQQCEAARA